MPLPRGTAHLLRSFAPSLNFRPGPLSKTQFFSPIQSPHILRHNIRQPLQRRCAHSPADEGFESVLDRPPTLVRTGGKHNPYGLAFLALIPIISFALGCWQVHRLNWKTDLIARYEDRLILPPLPLPPQIDLTALSSFDFRRIFTTGKFRHSGEMLLGPRIHEGENGFMVITPLDRPNGASTILINRGWIPQNKQRQEDRDPEALPKGEVQMEGLLRHDVWKKNIFTPKNKPERGEFYFPDIEQMAGLVGAQPVWVEMTMEPDYVETQERMRKGIPVGRPAEVNLRNNHMQYIVTWYALSAATTFMFYLLVKKPPSDITRRVRQNRAW
ncbi:COX1 assembly protein [Terfezia claveryi]|nr:COX1 assembly protein [Terfezia claveryi]